MDIQRFRVTPGSAVSLDAFDPADTEGIADKKHARHLLKRGIDELSDWQEKLYAQDVYGLLILFQAMDAAGKDSTIEHVMSGVNPQGCQVYSFKAPSTEERDHDFLWRHLKALPERGRIGIHNRSWYEEVLVVRVHPELLARQKLPRAAKALGEELWRQRFEDINAVERYLVRNGIVVLKFFLNVSKEEQKERFLKRITEPEKHWKFALGDIEERQHWGDYRRAYEDALTHTSTDWAPWWVIPADKKWFMRAAVAEVINTTLRDLGLRYPKPTKEQLAGLEEGRRRLEAEG